MEYIKGKFSIILPYFNGRRFIEEAITSVLDQTYTDFELIVIDDGSSIKADSEFLAGVLELKKDTRIRYIKKNNSGLSDTRNYGIRMGVGEFVAFIDQDDLWDKDKLHSQAGVFDADPAVSFICTDGRNIGEVSEERRTADKWGFKGGSVPDTFGKLLIGNFVICSSVAFRRNVIAEAGYSDRNYNIIPDYEYVLRISKNMDFYFIPRSLVSYRMHAGNTSKQRLDGSREVITALLSVKPEKFLHRVSLLVNILRHSLIWVWFRFVRIIKWNSCVQD